jgi:hypothetical protein
MTFEELKAAGHVEHHRCGICGVPVGYSIHPQYAAAVFNSACGCSAEIENYRVITNDELAALRGHSTPAE